ncbi:preprotein translocase subunit SecA [Acinetobacter radioresistens]|uniref:preprotein translocase subunit SecA n=1 Tax=Acinetobacter radioresistens TaxID=40216 RepID=UPI00224710C9|nr:preprotein translocase subunit SecA [Acinetobacter radioresistens]MCX0340097.1 preprotein translocase subunit SecA [Acinetobacter radioresistens]
MQEEPVKARTSFIPVRHDTLAWKLFLVYDVFMMVLIVINLVCLSGNAILMSDFGEWLFEFIRVPETLQFYKTELRPWVIKTEGWFTSFLVVELLVRWLIAIIYKHHPRWFFFPFIHWYELLAIIPQLRFLRLLRAGVIAYRLNELGYQVIPESIYKRALFYYHVVMEELSSRVVLTILDGVHRELVTSTTHKKLIHDLVDHHRDLFAAALAQVLQESLALALKEHQNQLSKEVGLIVNRAIEETPELTQLLRLIPIVGSRIEQQIQSIGQRLGENITYGLIDPLVDGTLDQPNSTYMLIAQRASQLNINNQALEQLVESAVFESLESIRKQVKIKQWQQILAESKVAKE